MKKVKVLVRDRNVLVLEEDALKGDIIDLREVSDFDYSYLEKVIEEGRSSLFESKIKEERENLAKIHRSEINRLNDKIEDNNRRFEDEKKNLRLEIENKYKEEISELKSQISNSELIKKNAIFLKESELSKSYEEKVNSLKSQVTSLENELKNINRLHDLELENVKKDYESTHSKEINDIKLASSNEIFKVKEDYLNIIKEKEEEISSLKNQKAQLNVKQTGENLETFCDNLVKEQMQNGFVNCTWEKDNSVVKDEGEVKGSKADYIFKIFVDESHEEKDLLTSICLDMKDENPDSKIKQTNDKYYKQLDTNRKKKNCKYAVLVSNLELDKTNFIPILKVREYEDMYVVRPGYLMTFLNLVTSLTNRFRDLISNGEKEELELKNKLEMINEFEDVKRTYLDKPLDNLKKNIETITSSTEAIRKANAKIEETCANISNKYILEIEAKINKFQINLERTYKRHKID